LNRRPLHPIREEVQEISKGFERLQQEHEDLKNFLTKYDKVKDALEFPEKASLDVKTKRAIILSSEDYLENTSKELTFVQENEKYINSDDLQGVPALQKKLSPLELQSYNLQEQTLAQNAQLESLLLTYNDVVKLLSEKFVYWDTVLTRWEKGLDKIKASKEHHEDV